MKQFFVLGFALLSAIRLFGQNDEQLKPYITTAGTPFGDIVSAKIGSNGGKLMSADKELEVIIPANSLDSEVNISIQSTHNELNENEEGAYQLEPSGIQFREPVQLIFHFSDEDADLKNIAWQDDKGQWHQVRNINLDSIQKTVSCLASHFSRWTRFDKIYMVPKSATVKVNKSIALLISSFDNLLDAVHNEYPDQSDTDLLTPPRPTHYNTGEWTVNGISPGNNEVGIAIRQNNRNAIYKAPAIPPDDNPVAVSVQVYSDKKNKKLLLTSNITVVGNQYHFTFIHIDENGCYFLVDSSSCILNMQKHTVSMSGIKNYPPWSDWPSSCDGCKWEWTNKESLKGLVELAGIASSRITPVDDTHPLPNVNISFSPAVGNTPSARVTCPKGATIPIPSKPYPASPQSINFDIDGDDVIIHAAGKTGRNELVIPGDKQKTMIYIYKVN